MENKKASVSSCVRGVLHFLRPYRGKAILALFMVIVSQLTFALNPSVEGLITSQLTQDAMEIVNGTPGAHVHFDVILRIMLVLLGLYLLKTVSQLITSFFLTDAIQGAMHDLRNALQQKIQQAYQDNSEAFQKAQQEKMQPITTKLLDAIKAVGKAGGYVYIMDLSAGIPYVSDTLSKDVTAEVKAELNKMK